MEALLSPSYTQLERASDYAALIGSTDYFEIDFFRL